MRQRKAVQVQVVHAVPGRYMKSKFVLPLGFDCWLGVCGLFYTCPPLHGTTTLSKLFRRHTLPNHHLVLQALH